MKTPTFALPALLLATGLALATAGGADTPPAGANFRSDLALLKQHTDVLVLSDRSGKAQIAVVPQFQGRVMTSTASGLAGDSYGWINRKLIASGKLEPHINAFGGEDRIWFGPEGGQFGLFFPPGAPFDFAHWQTPAPIDTQAWAVTRRSRQSFTFGKTISLINRSGTPFHFRVSQQVRLISSGEISAVVGKKLPASVRAVGYETDNKITNSGPAAWKKKSGLLSIWILGQYNPSPTGAIVIPFKPGPVSKMGKIVNDAYFGKVPAEPIARGQYARGAVFQRRRQKARQDRCRARPGEGHAGQL